MGLLPGSLVFIAALLFVAPPEAEILKTIERVFVNENCEINSTCDLKKARIVIEDYSVRTFTGDNFGTRIFVSYETARVEDLENYVFVAFKRGCMFRSKMEKKKVQINFSVDQPYLYNFKSLRFIDWHIDSNDADPAYNSYHSDDNPVSNPRHYNYRWNRVRDSFSPDTEVHNDTGIPPEYPELYVSDRPGVAYYTKKTKTAKNISLEFKFCIFKNSDVPLTASQDNINFAEPIQCFEASSSWVYNHAKKRYEQPEGIVSACQ